jgi:heat shock protein HtpX
MPERFRPDLRLQVCMAIVLLLEAVVTVAVVGGLVWLVFVANGWSIALFISMFAFLGATTAPKQPRRRGRGVRPADRDRVRARVERLCVIGDIPEPAVSVVGTRVAQSWTLAVPWRAPTVFVTTGLLDALDGDELEAVLAHELSHIAHRDAIVMTIAAAPGIWVLRGVAYSWREDRFRTVLCFPAWVLLGAFAVPSALIARVLSRVRERAADAGAARLTGSPAAVSAALVALSEDLGTRRATDLRATAPAVLNILPAKPAHGIARLWATHPPLDARLAALERMEARLQRPTARTSAR